MRKRSEFGVSVICYRVICILLYFCETKIRFLWASNIFLWAWTVANRHCIPVMLWVRADKKMTQDIEKLVQQYDAEVTVVS